MGIQIRTIVKDNVAIRCDGCLEVIDGTPWRVNLLDIVAPRRPSPGPNARRSTRVRSSSTATPSHVRRWMAGKGYLFCRRGEVREIMRPVRIPDRSHPHGACATASIATTTSSSPPDPRVPATVDDDPPRHRFDSAPPAALSSATLGANRDTQIYPDMSREHRHVDESAVRIPPRAPDSSAPTAAEASRVRRRSRHVRPLAVAGTGQPAARRRSRHASALGGRGPDRGVCDPRRPPPVRSRDDRSLVAARRDRQATLAEPRRQPGAPDARLPPSYTPTRRRPRRPAPTTTIEREHYRRDGRRLVEALVAHLDADADDAADRDRSEAAATRPGRRPGAAARSRRA